jgi:hypothetical protein
MVIHKSIANNTYITVVIIRYNYSYYETWLLINFYKTYNIDPEKEMRYFLKNTGGDVSLNVFNFLENNFLAKS